MEKVATPNVSKKLVAALAKVDRPGVFCTSGVAPAAAAVPGLEVAGELVVRFEGQERTLDFAADNRFQTCFAAFYADCEHEVKPLRSGHRLCLVYNLTLAKGKKPPGAPRREEHVARVAEVLRAWAEGGEAPQKLAVPLGHQYTEQGLAWDALKGVDRA